jgi:hypothetical protein
MRLKDKTLWKYWKRGEKYAKIRHRGGFTSTKVLGRVLLCGCELACASTYKQCLDAATETYERNLDAALNMNPKLTDDQIALAIKIFYLDAAECATIYTACGLACLVGFGW